MTNKKFRALNWWSTPILTIEQKNAEQLNSGLQRIIFEKEREIVGKKGTSTPVAGLTAGLTTYWLEYNVLKWDYPECKELKRLVLEGFNKYIKSLGASNDPGMEIVGIGCWANILRPGESLTLHHHDPAFASAHYTIATGYEEGALAISPEASHTIYYRPGFAERSHGTQEYGPTVSPWDADWRISREPKPGNMIFFPSYVRHEVRPNFGTRERISIAMDFYVKKQNALIYFGGERWFVPENEEPQHK